MSGGVTKGTWFKSILFATLGGIILFLPARYWHQRHVEHVESLLRLYNTCMNSKPGSSLETLKEMFGEPVAIRERDSQTIVYLFGDGNYVVTFSDEIVAYQNKNTGRIMSLSCGEHAHAWGTRP